MNRPLCAVDEVMFHGLGTDEMWTGLLPHWEGKGLPVL